MPGDAEQVARVNVPESDALQFVLYLGGDFGRILHLRVSGDDDVAFAGALDGAGAAGFVNAEINGGHEDSPEKLSDGFYSSAQMEIRGFVIKCARTITVFWQRQICK
jgi:hypothetical protein